MKKIYLLLLTLSCFSFSHAQVDTTFWFALPEVSYHQGYGMDRPGYLRFISHAKPTNITVSVPSNPSLTPITVNLSACSSGSIDLSPFIDSLENRPGGQILNRGIYIHGNNPFSAYYDIQGGLTTCSICNSDIFSLKGKNALGTKFYIPLQTMHTNDIYNNHLPSPRSAFDIVATENNTSVTVYTTQALVGHAAGSTFTIALNKGQTYSCTAVSETPAGHPVGSRVTSDKPVAVTIKDDLLYYGGGGSDVYGDQIIPTDKLGKAYVTAKCPSSNDDLVIIIATQNNTQVYADGSLLTTLNDGQSYAYHLNSSATIGSYINASAPIYAFHITTTTGEFAGAILPAIDNVFSPEVRVSRTANRPFYLFIYTKAGNEGNFLLNGSAGTINAGSFSPVPGTSNAWMYARIDMSSSIANGTTATITNTSGAFHLAAMQGTNNASSYAYFSGFVAETVSTVGCASGSSVLKSTVSNATYTWSTGASTDSIIPPGPGIYWVKSKVNACTQIDTFIYSPTGTGSVSIGNTPDTICANDSLQICAPAGYSSYQWNVGNTTRCIFAKYAGNYYVTVTDANNCVSESNHKPVAVYPSPPVSVIVDGNKFSSFGAVTYQWLFNDEPISGATSPLFTAQNPGYYSLIVTDSNGCKAISSAVLFTSLNDLEQYKSIVYPNPSNGQFVFSLSNDMLHSKAEVFNTAGQRVYQFVAEKLLSEINLGILPKGIYTMRIISKEGKVSLTRIIIQ